MVLGAGAAHFWALAHLGVCRVLLTGYPVDSPPLTSFRRAPPGRRFLCEVTKPQETNMPNIPRLIPWNKFPLGVTLPTCRICREPVALENSKTDENGKAIHEECYALKMGLKAATTPPDC